MKLTVRRKGAEVVLAITPAGSEISLPPGFTSRITDMIMKANNKADYEGFVECIEGKWRTSESYDMSRMVAPPPPPIPFEGFSPKVQAAAKAAKTAKAAQK